MINKTFNREQIKEKFQAAQLVEEGGLLVHVRRDTIELIPAKGGGVIVGDRMIEDVAVIASPQDYSQLIYAFRIGSKPRIGGIYDLKKPFDGALVSTDAFPVDIQEKLDDLAIFGDPDRSYSWWDQLREKFGYKRTPQVPTFNAV